MLTTRNIAIFVGLAGSAMALAGHVWPGAFSMVGALISLIILDSLPHRGALEGHADEEELDLGELERNGDI